MRKQLTVVNRAYACSKAGSLMSLRALAWSMLILLIGCEAIGTVIVDIDYTVQISGRDAAGNVWRASPDEITQKRDPRAASPYGNVHYEGQVLEWRFGVSEGSLGYFMRSNLPTPVCVRFDQARLTSNRQAKEIPLRVNFARYGPIGGQIVLERNLPKTDKRRGKKSLIGELIIERDDPEPFFTAPTVCAQPGQGTTYGFVMDLSELFPSGQMFNINQAGKKLDYAEHGAGNWLKIQVPVEYEGKREEWEIILTAKDSRARMSYH